MLLQTADQLEGHYIEILLGVIGVCLTIISFFFVQFFNLVTKLVNEVGAINLQLVSIKNNGENTSQSVKDIKESVLNIQLKLNEHENEIQNIKKKIRA